MVIREVRLAMRLFVHFMKEQHSLLAAQNEARLHE